MCYFISYGSARKLYIRKRFMHVNEDDEEEEDKDKDEQTCWDLSESLLVIPSKFPL